MFKLQYKNIRMTSMTTPNVSIADFEQVNVSRVIKQVVKVCKQ